ncbi:MAG: heme ABC transporter permease CcmB [Chloroflexi bacterium]|nr:heme ABC transporter permease CcmB [Chloroflexota bacterium]MYF78476.1 heme ABC transporter permease CcmB [Chloroflexota bacterium]MYK62044.1 heme ABC transporter permease CcmB [Chloroflexota bacterium]
MAVGCVLPKSNDVRLTATLSIIWALTLKELRIESRNRDVAIAIVMFASLVIAIFAIAIEPTSRNAIETGPGVLWAAITFAGVVGLTRATSHELENDAVGALMMAPVSRDLLFIGKSLGNFLFLSVATVIVFVVFTFMFNLPVFRAEILLVALLSTIGFSSVGTLFSSLTFRVRAREVLLPMLFLPSVSPLLFAAIRVTAAAASGESWSASIPWLQLAVAYDVVFVTASALLFGYVLDD